MAVRRICDVCGRDRGSLFEVRNGKGEGLGLVCSTPCANVLVLRHDPVQARKLGIQRDPGPTAPVPAERRVRFPHLAEARDAALALLCELSENGEAWLKRKPYGWLLLVGPPALDAREAIRFTRTRHRGAVALDVTWYAAYSPERLPDGDLLSPADRRRRALRAQRAISW